MEFLKAIAASLWPKKHRKTWFPTPSLIESRGAMVSGALEFVIFGSFEWFQFARHFLAVANHFAKGNIGTQLVAVFLIVISEFFYPLSLLCIILAIEGAIRFVAALISGEVVPSLPVVLASRLWDRLHRNSQPVSS
jgi:hypothetical protein